MAGPSRRHAEGEEAEVDWLKLVNTKHDVHVRVGDKVSLDGLPYECNLLAVANSFDALAVGTAQDVRIHRLSSFHSASEGAPKDSQPVLTPVITIPTPARPVWIRFAHAEERLIIGTATGVQVHDTGSVLAGQTQPTHVISSGLPAHILDVIPNPAPPGADGLAKLVAILGRDGAVMLDVGGGSVSPAFGGPSTSASWSAKGKQIMVGQSSGSLVSYTPDGNAKAEFSAPDLDEPSYPAMIQWLENDLFLAGYARNSAEADEGLEIFTISRTKTEITYTRFYDPVNTMGFMGRSGLFRYFSALRQWGDQTKHLAFIMSGIASEVGIMRGTAEGKWELLQLDEATRAIMPVGSGDVEDSSCIGMALDLTSQKPIRRGVENGVEMPDLAPAPRLLIYSQEGFVISFDVRYPDGGLYQGMVQPQVAPAVQASTAPPPATPAKAAEPPALPTTTPAAPPPSPSAFGGTKPNAFGSSGFGSSAFGNTAASGGSGGSSFGASGFGASSTPQSGSAFGTSAFGGSSTPQRGTGFGPSAFGKPSTPAGTAPTSAFGSSGFGSSTTPQSGPAFGSSGFGQSSTPQGGSAFGASAFGGTAKVGGSAFGSTGFGQSAFGQSSKSGSAFGSTSPSAPSAAEKTEKPATTAFGQAASTTRASKPASTGFGFGQSSTPSATPGSSSAFGQSAFGQQSKPSAFGTSAFGQSAFGSQAQKPSTTGFGQSAFSTGAATGGFAGFGKSAGQSAFAAAASAPASGSGDSGTAAPAASAFTGFGQPAKSAFGGSAFGQATGSGGAFGKAGGEGSAFGKDSVFGTTSATAKGNTTSATNSGKDTSDIVAQMMGQQDDNDDYDDDEDEEQPEDEQYGAEEQLQARDQDDEDDEDELDHEPEGEDNEEQGGGDFALGGLGLALGGTTTAKPKNKTRVGLSPSPESAPMFGVKKPVPGLEDDSPVNSPPTPKMALPKLAQTQSSTSSYIKPSSAFGSASSFGAFGAAAASSTPKSGTGAFGSSAFGSSAFGAGSSSTTPSGTPNAFSGAASSSTPTKAPASGSNAPAFGQTSSLNKTGFGTSGFGGMGQQKSAFGSPSASGSSSSPSPFGSSAAASGSSKITGGFGGFANKTAGMASTASAGGFAGFGGAAKAGASPFGATKATDKDKEADKPATTFGSPAGLAGVAAPQPGKSIFDAEPVAKADSKAAPPIEDQAEAPAAAPAKTENADAPNDQVEGAEKSEDVVDASADLDEEDAVEQPEAAPMPAGYTTASPGTVSDPARSAEPIPQAAAVPLPASTPLEETAPIGSSSQSPSATSTDPDESIDVVVPESNSDKSDSSTSTGEHITAADAEPDTEESAEEDVVEEDEEGELVSHEDADEETLKPTSSAEEPDFPERAEVSDHAISGEVPSDDDAEKDAEGEEASEGSSDELSEEDDSEVDELPSIEEAEEDDGEAAGGEDKVQQVKDGLKSPPTWFAKTAQKTASADTTDQAGPSEPKPEPPSLFARLSPAPAAPASAKDDAPKDPTRLSSSPSFSFASPHAVRASSPLGSQPPTTAGITSPEKAAPVNEEHTEQADANPDVKPDVPSLFAPKPVEVKQPFAATATPVGLFGNVKAEKEENPKPASPLGFSAFGQPTPALPPASISEGPLSSGEAAKSKPVGFGLGLGKPPTATSQTTTPAATANTGPFNFGPKQAASTFAPAPPTFGSTASRPGSSLSDAPPAFGSRPAEAPKSPFAGFGQGSSSVGSAASSPAGYNIPSPPTTAGFGGFGLPVSNAPSPAASSAPFPSFGKVVGTAPGSSVSAKQPQVPIATPAVAPATQAPPPPPPSDYFDVPVRASVPAVPKTSAVKPASSMGDILAGKAVELRADIENITALITSATRFHDAVADDNFIRITADNIADHEALPFSKIGEVYAVVKALIKDLEAARKVERDEEKLVMDLQALVAKGDVKKNQLDKLAEVRSNPALVQELTTTSLDAEQETSQINLRAATAEVEASLAQLEAALAFLKAKSEPGSAAEGSRESDLRQSIRNADNGLINRQQTIEDLSRRLTTVRLGSSTSTPAGLSSPSPPSSPYSSFLDPRHSFMPQTATIGFKVPAKVTAEVAHTVEQQGKVKNLLSRLKGRTVRVVEAGKVSESAEVVDIDSLPLPEGLKEDLPHTTEARVDNTLTPPTPLPQIALPSNAFAGLQFNLNPGQFQTPASSRDGSLRAGSMRTNKKTTSAIKYVPSPDGASAARPQGSFVFNLPKP